MPAVPALGTLILIATFIIVSVAKWPRRRGRLFGLLGPSGCGKTTPLRMLAGFETPTAGEIVIDGDDCSTLPPCLRPLNKAFQNFAIFPNLNVFQNIAYGLGKDRLSRRESGRLVNKALDMIKLPGFGDRAADQLSGGQRQGIALARALVKEPKVLLLYEALTMSDRITVMSEGRVLETDTPTGPYERPRTRFVAEFLGSMHFLDGGIQERTGSGHGVEVIRPGPIDVPAEATGLHPGDPVTVAVRPENIHLRDSASPGTGTGTVRSISYLGDRTIAHVEMAGYDTLLTDYPCIMLATRNPGRCRRGAACLRIGTTFGSVIERLKRRQL